MHTSYATTFSFPPDTVGKVADTVKQHLADLSLGACDLSTDGDVALRDRTVRWHRTADQLQVHSIHTQDGVDVHLLLQATHDTDSTTLQVRRRWQATSSDHPAGIPQTQQQPPQLVRQLAATSEAADSHLKFTDSPAVVDEEHVGQLLAELTDTRRQLPVVVISQHPRWGPQVNPETAAKRLLGLAHVRLLADPHTSSRVLSACVGDIRGCYGGAARLYWPGFTDDCDPRPHRYWPSDLLNTATNAFLQWVATQSTAVSAASLPPHLCSAVLGADTPQVRPEGGGTAEVEELHNQIGQLQAALAELQQQQNSDCRFDSVLAATEQAAQDFPALAWCPETFDAASASTFQRPGQVYDLLQVLAEGAHRYAHNELAGGWHKFFDQKGLQYATDVSAQARHRWPSEYRRRWNGQDRWLGPHLKVGNGPPDRCLRIYWLVEPQTRQVVVGHVGRHLTDQHTNG